MEIAMQTIYNTCMKEQTTMESIKKEHLQELLEQYKKDKAATISRHALSNSDISVIA